MKNILAIILIILGMAGCDDAEYPKSLVNGYYITVNASNYTVIQHNKVFETGIRSAVLRYNFDSIYIIAETVPADSIWRVTHHLITARQLIRESKVRQYWVIDTRTNSDYGPFTKENYLIKFKEIGVPDSLKLLIKCNLP